MVRAIILWAEGRLPDAESAAREAATTDRPQQLNNLGALLLDQQKLEPAREMLVRAAEIAPELSQAHANLGRLMLDLGQPEAAIDPLRTAAQLAPESPPIVATLGEAYRRNGQLQQARIAMQRVLTLDEDNGPALAEQSVLTLTPVLTATKQLEWELELPPTLTPEQLVELRVQTETGIGQIEALRNEFLRQAAAYGVATRQPMQRLAEKQAAVLEQELLNRRYQLMLVQIEQGRVLAEQPRSRLRRFWDAVRGARTPLQEAIATSVAALRQEPSLPLQYDYHYQQGRAAYLSGNSQLAQTQFDAAASLVNPESSAAALRIRPEHHYGKARLLNDQNLRDDARTELAAALVADERFFPAHQLLANMAVADKRWADAETHYRWLAQNRTWIADTRIQLARTLREQRKDVEAEAELVPLANADNVEAMVMLAAIYRSADKLNEAGTVLQRALSVDPSAASAHEEAAKLALARNDPQTAETELRRALELDPQRTSAHIALAQLYSSRGQPAAAAEQFQAAVANQSNDPLVHRQLGEVLLQIGNPQAAAESFERAIELDPNAHEAHHGLATAYLAQRRFDAAAREEERALELANGNYTLAIVGLGDIDREQGRFEQAVERYNTALERDPQLAVAYLGLGKASFGQGRHDIALMHYRRGLEIEPENVLLLLGVGDALLQQNDTAAAREAYQRARELAPDNAAASAGLGRTLWREGQTDAALVELNRAVQLNPQDAETLLTIGEVYLKQERNEQALQAFGQAAEVRDDWFEPHFRRGVLLLQQQQVGDAIEELERTVRLNQNFAQGNYWLGRAYRAAGQFTEARGQFQRAIELQNDYFEARFFLGRTLDELGQAPDAVTTYEAILGEAPEGNSWRSEAARELDRIR
jgi:tetratricopeptide (TPR) repeat protein